MVHGEVLLQGPPKILTEASAIVIIGDRIRSGLRVGLGLR